MSDQGKHDKANTKPGDLRAETARRVGLTVDEQNRCRREGASMMIRAARRLDVGSTYSSVKMALISSIEGEGSRRWGPDWEVDG